MGDNKIVGEDAAETGNNRSNTSEEQGLGHEAVIVDQVHSQGLGLVRVVDKAETLEQRDTEQSHELRRCQLVLRVMLLVSGPL